MFKEEITHYQTAELNALRAENCLQKKQIEELRQAYENLHQQMQNLLRHRFGTRSERHPDPTHPQLDFLTEHLPDAAKRQEEEDAEQITIQTHQRKKKKSLDTSAYPREIKIITVPGDEKICQCGCEKILVRYETKELFDYQPAVFRIIEQRREVVACPKHCEGSMKVAPVPLQILPKTKVTENLLAHIVVSKLHHRQPLYHLEKYVNAIGASRETMARWMIQLVKPLQPLFNLMKDEIIEYDIASIDATTLQVLNEPGRPAERKSYAYCMRGGPPEKAVVLYDYNHSEHKQYVDEWLEGFSGIVHMDADPFFHQLIADAKVAPSFCNAHARRKFESVMKLAKKQGLAHEAVRFYKKLYHVERKAKEDKLTPALRFELRQKESKPIMNEFKQWLDQKIPLVLPKSPLGNAFTYCIKHWEGLRRFLEDGRLEIDNNLTEQAIKPFVIARKNFMFANSMEGAQALCLHFSLIRSALVHGLDPYEYYAHILKEVPHCKAVEDYEKLLPWNICFTALSEKSTT